MHFSWRTLSAAPRRLRPLNARQPGDAPPALFDHRLHPTSALRAQHDRLRDTAPFSCSPRSTALLPSSSSSSVGTRLAQARARLWRAPLLAPECAFAPCAHLRAHLRSPTPPPRARPLRLLPPLLPSLPVCAPAARAPFTLARAALFALRPPTRRAPPSPNSLSRGPRSSLARAHAHSHPLTPPTALGLANPRGLLSHIFSRQERTPTAHAFCCVGDPSPGREEAVQVLVTRRLKQIPQIQHLLSNTTHSMEREYPFL